MRVLLAGATGAIGRPLVRRLVDAGHEVVGLTRRPERVAELDAAGARGIVCDVLDLRAVLAVSREVAPEVVLDQTTALPQRYDPRKMHEFYRDMIPLRTKGSPNLLDAAREAGAHHVFQSIAFLYAPGHGPRTEDDRVFGADAPTPWDHALPGIVALEERTVEHGGLVLRFGQFYGPRTHFDGGGQIHDDVRRRRFPLVGGGSGVFSFIHVDDAAEATVAAVERRPTGILNVVDDTPTPVREWLPLFAASLGAKPPRRVPAWLARRIAGPLPTHMSTTMPGASNARARRDLDWAPLYPSFRDGLRAA